MITKIKRLLNLKLIITSILSFGLLVHNIYSKDVDLDKLIPSKKNPALYEIGEINFIGIRNFTASFLLTVISSQENSRSIPHKFLENYADNIDRTRAAPKQMKYYFKKSVDEFQNEIKYFDKAKASDDALKIQILYNQNGYQIGRASCRERV